MESFNHNKSGNLSEVLVVSNVTVDETYSIESMPLPGQSLIDEWRSRNVGGNGANVATVLSRTGVHTTLLAGIGTDERSAYIYREGTRDLESTVAIEHRLSHRYIIDLHGCSW
jgi:sugar/nucleoside kinase (ribokinase family)